MDLPLLADLERESPRKRCTSRKDLSLLAVKGLPDLCDEKEALLEGPTLQSLEDEELSSEWDREAARLRLAMMRAVESASAAGSDDDFSSFDRGDPIQARGMGQHVSSTCVHMILPYDSLAALFCSSALEYSKYSAGSQQWSIHC